MATILIPTTTDAAYSRQKVRLEGVDYLLDLAFNQREGRWYLHIYDADENPILAGLKLVANWPLLRRYHANPAVPPGELMAISLNGDRSPPGFSDLGVGRRVELTYFDAATMKGIVPPKPLVAVPVWVAFSVTTSGGYVGDAKFRQLVANALNLSFRSSDVLSADDIASRVGSLDLGVSSLTVTGLGTSANPTTTGNVRINRNAQFFAFVSGGITVESS